MPAVPQHSPESSDLPPAPSVPAAEPAGTPPTSDPGDGSPRKRRRRRRGRRKRGQGGAPTDGQATTPNAVTAAAAPSATVDQIDDGPDDGPDDGSSDDSPEPGASEPEQPVPTYSYTGILDVPMANGRPNASAETRLRQFADGLIDGADDPLVPPDLFQRYPLRPSQRLTADVALRKPRRRRAGGRKPRPVVEAVQAIEGLAPEVYAERKQFADLTPLDPAPRMTLEYKNCPPACRLIDLFCPIGFGTRGLIVAPPKAGKTILLQNIAFGIKQNHPNVELVALLIDERPEEVTDFKRNVPAQVLASSNDQDLDRHLSLGILAIERAKRMVEAGKDVVVLLDSLTRLGRAFNNSKRYGSSGKIMSGGLDSRALEVPKQLFGAARRAEEGGSLTIIASCLVDTGSRADQIIFEEFKGTGNMELILDREISEKRLFPAINLAASGTRKEHLLLTERELKTVTALRRRLLAVPPWVQIEQLLGALQRFPTNEALVAG